MRYGDPGATRAQLHHCVQFRIRQASAKAFGKAEPVGIVPQPPAIGENDGVDRLQDFRIARQLIDAVDGRPLAGMGDVEAGKTLGLGLGNQRRQRFGPDAEDIEIDALIVIIEALQLPLAHMHGRGQRLADAGPDQSYLQ